MAFLDINGLSIAFGGLQALINIDLSIKHGEIRGLIGPNGAGKTTLINVVSRIYKPDSGSITFNGEDILKFAPYQIVSKGIVRTFQIAAPFSKMSVLHNIVTGFHVNSKSGIISAMLAVPWQRAEERRMRDEAEKLLHLVQLDASLWDRPAGSLPLGQLRLMEIARSLATKPKLLLLDEPGSGMNSGEVEAFVTLLRHIRSRYDLTILLVEHNVNLVMDISDKVTVLDHGEKLAEGYPNEVRHSPEVIEAYIGDETDTDVVP
jgi:branched-chain amino acid transport system ATP-binding protein